MKTLLNRTKKAFTLVELVVVIAVIAILAAVSVASFIGINNKARFSNDQSLTKQWNTVIQTKCVIDENALSNVVDVKNAINENGYRGNFVPESKNYHYYWSQSINEIYLTKDKDDVFDVQWPLEREKEAESLYSTNPDDFYILNSNYIPVINNIDNCIVNRTAIEPIKNATLSLSAKPKEIVINLDKENYSYNSDTGVITFVDFENINSLVLNSPDEVKCFAKGTIITMGDGTFKAIENINLGDEVLTFNHETSTYESQKVYIDFEGEYKSTAFTLIFENNNRVSVVGEHDLFEKESLKYTTITDKNAKDFVGKHFFNVNENKYLKLNEVIYETTETSFYSIYTTWNNNCVANGFLSVPDDVDFFLNFYEFNEDLSINHKQLEKDIETFGLFQYSEDATYSYEIYDTLRFKYVLIIIGKGLFTWEGFQENLNYFLSLSN